MKRLTMVLVFIALGAAVAGGYWYWQQSQQSASDGAKAKGKGAKGAKGGRGGPLTVKAARAVVKPMPVLIEAVGTVEAEQSVQVGAAEPSDRRGETVATRCRVAVVLLR